MNPRPRNKAIDRLNNRRRAIKAAWRATGLDDEAYRQMLMQVAGVETSLALGLASANHVLDHINQHLGRDQAQAHPGKPDRVRQECTELIGKIEALLADMGLPWGYGLTILKHQGVDAWAFATHQQMSAVIAALSVEQSKRLHEAQVVAALADIGRDRTAGETIARALGSHRPSGWHRDLKLMDRMLTHIANVLAARGQK